MIIEQEFKNIVSRFPTGVTVITCSYKGKLYGFTANSFASVSLDPPLILFCISKTSGSYEAFMNAEYFAVNFLASNQEDIAKHFASRAVDKFADIDFTISPSGVLLLNECLGYIENSKYAIHDAGDHSIILGKVIDGSIVKDLPALTYHDRKFGSIPSAHQKNF